MTHEEATALQRLLALDIATGWKIDRLFDIINQDNVDEVIASLSPELREMFVFACENQYDLTNTGKSISIPDASARDDPQAPEAVRLWLERTRAP